jgi:hypothetical protein
VVTTVLIPLCAAVLLSFTPGLSTVALAKVDQPVTGRVTGTVVEARTNAPLAAVLVKVQSTGQQAFSDADGRFEIADVPSGAQTLVISVVGYGLVRRDVTITAGETVDAATIAVAEGASTYVEDVAVSAGPFRETESGVASQSVLGSRELLALRGLIADDPFRAAQMLPAVATGDDFRAEFSVRGLGPSNIGVSVDGVDSALLFHTVRNQDDAGSLGLVNSDILESATLLSGAHPQRLHSHLGSRLDFTTRDGSRERLTVRAMVSASAASTVWEGPFGSSKKASWLVAVRQSYIDWLLKQIDTTTGAAFGFFDGQAKLTMDLSPRQQLRASFIGGRSLLTEEEDDPGLNTLVAAESRTFIGNLQWRLTPSSRLSVSQQVYVVKADYENRVTDGRAREQGDDLDVTWRGGADWMPAPAHRVEFGAQAQSLDAVRIERGFAPSTTTTFVDADVAAWTAAGWAQYRWTPNARLTVSPGVRVERWDLVAAAKASPWLLTEYEIRPGLRARFSAGVQFQPPSVDQALFVLPDTQLVPERARTIEGGLEQRIGESVRLYGSVYHRRDSDRLRYEDSEVRIENDRVVLPRASNWQNALHGDAKGLELTVERRSASGLNGWFSYAWNTSELGDSASAEQFYADWDQRHTVNAYVAYRWSGRTSLSSRMRYGSNFPIRGYIGEGVNGYVLSAQRNGVRLPAYARLDIRADRAFTYRNSRLTLFIEVINATNRDNFRYDSSTVNLVTRRVFDPTESMFPLLPVAGVLFEF